VKTKPSLLAYLLAAFLVCVTTLPAQSNPALTQANNVQRVLVKLRAPLAQEVEAELPLQGLALTGRTRSGRVQAFMDKHAVQGLAPLYPNLVRMKKQLGLSDIQMASRIRQRFARRARRVRTTLSVPEISRTYLLELKAGSPAEMARARRAQCR